MALNDKLITIADVRIYRDIDTNYDQTRFDAFLTEIQNCELQELLGSPLWLDFFKNIVESKYQTLLDGEEYEYSGDTVLFGGLKPFLVWSWLNLLPLEGNLHHSASGDLSYLREQSSSPSKAVINQAKENYKRNMVIEQNSIIQYLNEKSSTYPLWNATNKESEIGLTIDFI